MVQRQFGWTPRAGSLKPASERRLSDLVSVGVLMRTFPPGWVDEVIAEAGRTEQRHRSLEHDEAARLIVEPAVGRHGLAHMSRNDAWRSTWPCSRSSSSSSCAASMWTSRSSAWGELSINSSSLSCVATCWRLWVC